MYRVYVEKFFNETVNPKLEHFFPKRYLNKHVYGLDVKPAPGKFGLPVYYEPASVDGSRKVVFSTRESDYCN